MSIELLKSAKNIADISSAISDPETKQSFNNTLCAYFLDKIPESVIKNKKAFNEYTNNVFGKDSFEAAFLQDARKKSKNKNELYKNLNKLFKDIQKDNDFIMNKNLHYLYLDKVNGIDRISMIKEFVSHDFNKKISKIPDKNSRPEEQIAELEKFLNNPKNEDNFKSFIKNYVFNKIENYPLKNEKDVKILLKDLNDGKITFPDNERNLQICLESSCAKFLKPDNETDFKSILGKEINNSYNLGQSFMMKLYLENLSKNFNKPQVGQYFLENDSDSFRKERNKNILNSYEDGLHPLQTNTNTPAVPRDLMTGKEYHDIQNMLAYCKNAGVPFVVFGDANFIMENKRHWLEGKEKNMEKNAKKGRFPVNICWTGIKDEITKLPTFAVKMPLAQLNQTAVEDTPKNSDNNIAPNPSVPNTYPVVLNTPQDVENYLIANQANYINSSKTGLPYSSLSHDGDNDKFMKLLTEAVNQNQNLFHKINYLAEKIATLEKNNNINVNDVKNIQENNYRSPDKNEAFTEDCFKMYNELKEKGVSNAFTRNIDYYAKTEKLDISTLEAFKESFTPHFNNQSFINIASNAAKQLDHINNNEQNRNHGKGR